MSKKITEDDLKRLFISTRLQKPRGYLAVFFRFIIIFFMVFVSIFIFLNYSAYWQKLSYWYRSQFEQDQPSKLSLVVETSETTSSNIPNISDNSLYIESLNLTSPITFRVANNETAVRDNLLHGLIQLDGSSLPGEKGNVFITGHSSNFPWVKSQYNSIFALLDNVAIGDFVLLKYQNTNYIYQVKEKFVVSPTETSVINPNSDQSTLTLMTCVPIGTNLKRLIVKAEQILPDAKSNRPSSVVEKTNNLPAGVK